MRLERTYLRQSMAVVMVALVATMILIWNQAPGAKAALVSGEPVIRAAQQAVSPQASEIEKCREPESCPLALIRFGRLTVSTQLQNAFYWPCPKQEKV